MHFRNLLKESETQLLLVENATQPTDYAKVDLSESTLNSKNIKASNEQQLQTYLDEVSKTAKAKVLYGGYLEKRNLYANSVLFNSESTRNIHLGVDFWAAAGMGILAPLDGIVHAAHYNEGEGNYGGTLILKHSIRDFSFFSLYGHLSKSSLHFHKGESIAKGSVFCHLGEASENGYYLPHLHFQWILELTEEAKDYPGVCSENEIAEYAKNSPKPELKIENSRGFVLK
jgi:murein DD-endopeptidase MepM/ murein hydrolase activator NlpD